MTCKQLTEKLQNLNKGIKIEVKKVTSHGRVTGNTTSYQLQVNNGKFVIGALTLKQLVKDIHNHEFNGVLHLQARYGKYETAAIILDER